VLGGAVNVDEREANPWLGDELELISGLLAAGVPLLGVCLGSQLLATAAGGAARRAAEPEIGWFGVDVNERGATDPLLRALAPAFEAFQWHSYECVLPDGAVELATSPICPQAYRLGDSAWGVQFHPEVSRADALHWIDDYESDPDAIRIGIDPEALRAESEPRLDAWNELGRELCERFLDAAAT
jgi:GMP synthase (glutamine-hydrolysing)